VPLAISREKLSIITSQVTLRLLVGEQPDKLSIETKPVPAASVPVVKVFDSLVAKGGVGDSGYTSYESLTNELASLANNGNKTIALYIDSPGGEVNGLFALTDYIKELQSKGIEIVGLVDGLCCSASYAIGSACSKLLATNTSEIGSIGVIAALVDRTAQDASAGISYTILRSSNASEKALGNSHEATTPEVVSNLQSRLDELESIFFAAVNKCRPKLSLQTIAGFKGNTLLAEKALEMGLIDGIITSAQTYLESMNTPAKGNLSGNLNNDRRGNQMNLEEAQSQIINLTSELQQVKASLASAEAKGRQEEQARLLAIVEAGATFGIPSANVVKVVKAGFSVEQAVINFEMAKETAQNISAIDTVVPTETGVAVSAPKTEGEYLAQIDKAFAVDRTKPSKRVGL
jgi:ClpP class serine protease